MGRRRGQRAPPTHASPRRAMSADRTGYDDSGGSHSLHDGLRADPCGLNGASLRVRCGRRSGARPDRETPKPPQSRMKGCGRRYQSCFQSLTPDHINPSPRNNGPKDFSSPSHTRAIAYIHEVVSTSNPTPNTSAPPSCRAEGRQPHPRAFADPATRRAMARASLSTASAGSRARPDPRRANGGLGEDAEVGTGRRCGGSRPQSFPIHR